jgi:hypothetical protein
LCTIAFISSRTNRNPLGKFSIYDLRSQTISQKDLLVTHKLFSLATLDVSASTRCATNGAETPSSPVQHHSHLNSFHRYQHHGAHTPASNTSHLRFSTTPHNGSLHEGSRSSSKLSLSGLVKRKEEASNAVSKDNSDEEEEEDVMNKQTEPENVYSTRCKSVSDSLSTHDEDDSDYESVPWSEGSETEDEPGCDLFVACAWNGVTYLIDWSKRLDDDADSVVSDLSDDDKPFQTSKIKYQLVKFAFEGRVCAFTAGLYTVENHVNVPCLFYVDFEDQIYVYYDVRISPGPVTGFIDTIDDDIDEALDRIIGIESGIEALTESHQNESRQDTTPRLEPNEDSRIDLGDGWHGIADEDEDELVATAAATQQLQDSDPLSKKWGI